MQIDLEQLEKLMNAINQFNISELELERDGQRIRLARGGVVVQGSGTTVAVPTTASPTVGASPTAAAETEDDPNVHYVTSPFIGTFYTAPSPDADAFVKVGDRVASGQRVCIVEAMKLMNEIESEVAGELLEVLVENGKSVEFGEKLFKLRKG